MSVIDPPKMRAAHRLIGMSTPDGWVVTKPLGWSANPDNGGVIRNPYGTGGNFSVGYEVSRQEERAYLKAIDLGSIANAPNIIEAMKSITDTVHFEQEIHRLCGDNKLDRIVRAIGSGQFNLGTSIDEQVPYIILELATGDFRLQIRTVEEHMKNASRFRALHHTAVALQQLHNIHVAHQDLKPSNVMSFSEYSFKVGDFGRSALIGKSPPHEDYCVAGDCAYAPPELLYNSVSPDWSVRRIGCDTYHLGSLISSFFHGTSMTSQILGYIDIAHRPPTIRGRWMGTYEEILPTIRTAFSQALEDIKPSLPDDFRDELIAMIAQLCDPDPALRGHPSARAQKHPYDLSRYISRFDFLAQRSEIEGRRMKQ